jgi:DNA-binding YbaB/EbfC family protein
MSNTPEDIIRTAQELQEKILSKQYEIASTVFSSESYDGRIKVQMKKNEMIALEIDPEIMHPENAELVSEMIKAAITSALRNIQQKAREEIDKITGGIDLPGVSEL